MFTSALVIDVSTVAIPPVDGVDADAEHGRVDWMVRCDGRRRDGDLLSGDEGCRCRGRAGAADQSAENRDHDKTAIAEAFLRHFSQERRAMKRLRRISVRASSEIGELNRKRWIRAAAITIFPGEHHRRQRHHRQRRHGGTWHSGSGERCPGSSRSAGTSRRW